MAHDESLKTMFGEWLALSKAERARLGLPKTQAEWARTYGLAAKTLTRWKQEGGFTVVPPPEVDEEDETTLDQPEGGLQELHDNLLAKALKGNEKATQQYMTFFGKAELERQRANQESRLRELSDDELIVEILEMLGRPTVEAWLHG